MSVLNNRVVRNLSITLLALGWIIACSNSSESTQPSLLDKEWVLQSFTDSQGFFRESVPSLKVTIEFSNAGILNGNLSCHRPYGYQLEGAALYFAHLEAAQAPPCDLSTVVDIDDYNFQMDFLTTELALEIIPVVSENTLTFNIISGSVMRWETQ